MPFLKKTLVAFLITLSIGVGVSFGAQPIEQKKALMLFPFRPTLPVASRWHKNVASILGAESGIRVDLDIEYLDLSRFSDPVYLQMMLDIFRYKGSESRPDLIVAVYEPAFNFVLKHGEGLFPGVPIVFGGIHGKFIEKLSLGPNITGYLRENNYTTTLDLALGLHPNTREVVVFAGAGLLGQERSDEAREAFRKYEDRLDFSYMIGLPMDELLEKLANLPDRTVVMALPFLKDGLGEQFVFNEVLTKISSFANAPVYTFWDTAMGTGIVGGNLINLDKEARAAARLSLRILKGEDPASIPITYAPMSSDIFDWRQLKRWSIAEDRLPPGSIVKFRELTVWDRYKGRILVVLALVLFQALIISYLLNQRRIRRKVEQNYRTVADYTFDWEYWENPDGSLQYVSPSCERICGYLSLDLMTNPSLLQDMIVPEDKEIWDKHRCGGQMETGSEGIQFRIQKPDGEIRWIEHACQPAFDDKRNNRGVRASNRDITERAFYRTETLKLQSELAHVDRVVTINALTSALAHEINQPLAAMRSYAQAALRFIDREHPDYDSVRKALEGIVSDNKRAAEVVNRLRSLLKKEQADRETINIGAVLDN